MKNLSNAILTFVVMMIIVSSIGIFFQRSYWKNRCFEIQDNYEAISKENEELRDSVYILNRKLSPVINKQRIYEITY